MERKKQASILRSVRRIHRALGASLFILFLVISLSGLVLGWKKNSGGYILPKSYKGTSTDLAEWLSVDSLRSIASKTLQDSVDSNLLSTIDRIDIRPEKGMVKFIFTGNFWEIQVDGATGRVLNIGKRHSDLIENIHDGSILDDLLGTNGQIFKLIYTSLMGISLFGFTVTGFWLWYGPKAIRNTSRKS